MYKYLISVIIPTRNRQKYAEAAARQILNLKQNIQVIVQDNSDDNILQERFTDLVKREEFIYNHIDERVAFVDNYEIATSYVEGEYLIALGDDDGILANITECVKWMKENNIDALKPSVKSSYWWPDSNSSIDARKEGVFSTRTFSGKVKLSSTRDAIIELLKHGGQGYLDYPLAGTYHRIIKMDLMNKVKNITGRYYGGLTPDMYSAACLSLLPGIKFVEMDYPISLPGVCPDSASAKSAKGEHSGKLETAPHFIGLKDKYIWDERIPKYYSVETIWAETLLTAIKDMGQSELIDQYFNKDYMLFYLSENNKNQKADIQELIGKEKISSLDCLRPRPKSHLEKLFIRGEEYILRRIPGNSVVYAKCKDIEEATVEMNRMVMSKIMRYKWRRLSQNV